MKPSIILMLLCVVTLVTTLPRWRANQLELGRRTELQKEMDASPEFADGYRAGERARTEIGEPPLSPEALRKLSEEEFKKSRAKDSINWRTGFEVAFEKH